MEPVIEEKADSGDDDKLDRGAQEVTATGARCRWFLPVPNGLGWAVLLELIHS